MDETKSVIKYEMLRWKKRDSVNDVDADGDGQICMSGILGLVADLGETTEEEEDVRVLGRRRAGRRSREV